MHAKLSYRRGDILRGRKDSDAIHPIVYLCDRDENFFFGAMLTKSPNYADNILMKKIHFKKVDSTSKKYEFCFNRTHLVKTKLIKRKEWGPFKKVGELTNAGIKFIESELSGKNSCLWEEYTERKNTDKDL